MKILIIDTSLEGHHLSYLEALTKKLDANVIYILPRKTNRLNGKVYTHSYDGTGLNILKYLMWIMFIKKIVSEESIDIIHFAYSDSIYRFCGIGLKPLYKNVEGIIATQHQLRESFIRWICLKQFIKKTNRVVVHTDTIMKRMQDMKIENVNKIDYTASSFDEVVNKKEARKYWNIPNNDVPVLGALGGTRFDKGLDILLDAMSGINKPFYLLIAGKEQDFNKEYVFKIIENYNQKVFVHLRYLTEAEFNIAINSCDCIVLPYRKKFNGASGPLAEGVWNRKFIIGPEHGSLGETIKVNGLGLVFETESSLSLKNKIEDYLSNSTNEINKKYLDYRNTLNPNTFKSEYQKVYNNVYSKY